MSEGSEPSSANRLATSGRATICWTVACSLSSTAGGVPAGASRPCQEPVTKSGICDAAPAREAMRQHLRSGIARLFPRQG